MQYAILIDGERIYQSTLRTPGMRIVSGTFERSINSSGMLTFEISEENIGYNKIKLMKSVVVLKRYLKTAGITKTIFVGRPISIRIGNENIKTVQCEGMSATLNDSVIEPFTLSTSDPNAIASRIINEHNSFTGGNLNINCAISGRTTTFDNQYRSTAKDLIDKFCDTYDCFYYPTYSEDFKTTINFYRNNTTIMYQTHGVIYGQNLISIETEQSGSDVFTELYPLGNNDLRIASGTATIDSDITRSNYRLKSASALSLYGRTICKIVRFKDCTTAASLQSAAVEYLRNYSQYSRTTTIEAIDTGDFDGVTPFEMIAHINVISPAHAPHELESRYQVTKTVYDLCNPANDRIEVGQQKKTFTAMV